MACAVALGVPGREHHHVFEGRDFNIRGRAAAHKPHQHDLFLRAADMVRTRGRGHTHAAMSRRRRRPDHCASHADTCIVRWTIGAKQLAMNYEHTGVRACPVPYARYDSGDSNVTEIIYIQGDFSQLSSARIYNNYYAAVIGF